MFNFKVLILKEAREFIDSIEHKAGAKILQNFYRVENNPDSELFKKISENIWEFRTLYNQKQYRLFAFWDKTEKEQKLVIATHGIIKKTSKVAQKEIDKANKIRIEYFKRKENEV